VPIIELVDTSHHLAEIESSNLDHSPDPEKAAASGGIRRYDAVFDSSGRRVPRKTVPRSLA
jgi:hypothetical protein